MASAELAKQQMHGFGGMLSIDVVGGGKAAECVEDHLQVFLLAAAWAASKASSASQSPPATTA
ncbi:hypothetical protein [Marinobacter gelidimuriae]|uniref:hypothetical protein n=1 Tax=Marinobacter gelidimuriae TaxID=2739064 RepID=UPI0003A6496E|nr:hypothetical protein [Marinobacter gelidimuriae]